MSSIPYAQNWGHLGVLSQAQFALLNPATYALQEVYVDQDDGTARVYWSNGTAWVGGPQVYDTVASEAEMLELTPNTPGAMVVRSDTREVFFWVGGFDDGDPRNWSSAVEKGYTYAQIEAMEAAGALPIGKLWKPSDKTWLGYSESAESMVWFATDSPRNWGKGLIADLPTELSHPKLEVGDTYVATDAEVVQAYDELIFRGTIDGDPAPSAAITGIDIDATAHLKAGMLVSGTGVTEGTTISSVDSASAITLSATVAVDVADKTFTAQYPMMTGNNTLGEATVTGMADTTMLEAGLEVFGPGVPPDTFIDTVDSGTQITLTNVTYEGSTGGEYRFAPAPTERPSPGLQLNYAGNDKWFAARNCYVQRKIGLPGNEVEGPARGIVSFTGAASFANSLMPKIALPTWAAVGQRFRALAIVKRLDTGTNYTVNLFLVLAGTDGGDADKIAATQNTNATANRAAATASVLEFVANDRVRATSVNTVSGGSGSNDTGVEEWSEDLDLSAGAWLQMDLAGITGGGIFGVVELSLEALAS